MNFSSNSVFPKKNLRHRWGFSSEFVNRWENGHTLPSQLAQQIEEMLPKLREPGQGLLSEYFLEAE